MDLNLFNLTNEDKKLVLPPKPPKKTLHDFFFEDDFTGIKNRLDNMDRAFKYLSGEYENLKNQTNRTDYQNERFQELSEKKFAEFKKKCDTYEKEYEKVSLNIGKGFDTKENEMMKQKIEKSLVFYKQCLEYGLKEQDMPKELENLLLLNAGKGAKYIKQNSKLHYLKTRISFLKDDGSCTNR